MLIKLTEAQERMRKTTRDFAEREIAPVAGICDENQELPAKVIEKMAKMKYFGLPIPEKYGGAGLENDSISVIIATEELGRVDASISITMGVHSSVCAYPILKYGTERQKEKYLPTLAGGEKIGAFCLTEAHSGSDANMIATFAGEDGDDYVLNGTKVFVTNGGIADIFLVVAVTEQSKPRQRLTTFILEKERPGFSIGKKENKLGVRASSTTEVHFRNVRLPRENILGDLHQGMRVAMGTLEFGRIGIAAQCVGLGQACLEASLRYSNERSQFGRKIGQFQMIQAKLANMAMEVEAARLLTYQAASLKDQGMPYNVQSSMAKLYASEAAMRAAHDAVQIHGGSGLMKPSHVERYFRDAKMAEIYEGTSEIQRMVIATSLLKEKSESGH